MARELLAYRVCIWDFDGTLFDSYPTMNLAMTQALEQLGHPRRQEEVCRLMKRSVSTALDFYRRTCSLGKELEPLFRQKEALLSQDLPPYPGALELCKRVCDAGGQNLLYTHRDSLSLKMLQRHGFSPYFSGGVTAEDGFPPKPAPNALQFLMGKFGFSPQEALMIGDRDIDLLAGSNAGIDGCLFDPHGDYLSFPAPYRGRSMSELGEFLFV